MADYHHQSSNAGEARNPGYSALIERLTHGDVYQRQMAAVSFGSITHLPTCAFLALAQALFDEDALVREGSCSSLMQQGSAARVVLNQLMERARSGSLQDRTNALSAIGYMGQEALPAKKFLCEMTHDDNALIRYRAVWALGQLQLQDPDIYFTLKEAECDNAKEIKHLAEIILKNLKTNYYYLVN